MTDLRASGSAARLAAAGALALLAVLVSPQPAEAG